MKQYYRLQIDTENNSEWWDNGGSELWESIKSGVDCLGKATYRNNDYIFFQDEEDRKNFLFEAEKIDGWESGEAAEFAPTPLLQEIDKVEEAYELITPEAQEQGCKPDTFLEILDNGYGLYSDEENGLEILTHDEWKNWEGEWIFIKK